MENREYKELVGTLKTGDLSAIKGVSQMDFAMRCTTDCNVTDIGFVVDINGSKFMGQMDYNNQHMPIIHLLDISRELPINANSIWVVPVVPIIQEILDLPKLTQLLLKPLDLPLETSKEIDSTKILAEPYFTLRPFYTSMHIARCLSLTCTVYRLFNMHEAIVDTMRKIVEYKHETMSPIDIICMGAHAEGYLVKGADVDFFENVV